MKLHRKLSFAVVMIALMAFTLPAYSRSSAMEHIDDDQIKALPATGSTVVIHFWATWCQPCLVEIPTLNRLQKKYQSEVQFVAVNMDDVENRGAIRGFLRKHPIDYRVVLRDGKDFGAMAQALNPEWKAGLPATFVFHDGKRVFSKIGMVDENELDRSLRQSLGKTDVQQ